MRVHIAFVVPPVKRAILAGEQTCESRLSVALHPAARTLAGDRMLFKCRDAFAIARVSAVQTYDWLNPEGIEALRRKYTRVVDGPVCDAAYWQGRRMCRFAVFLHFAELHRVIVPARLLPSTRFAWVQDYEPPLAVRAILDTAVAVARDSQALLEPDTAVHVPQVRQLPLSIPDGLDD